MPRPFHRSDRFSPPHGGLVVKADRGRKGARAALCVGSVGIIACVCLLAGASASGVVSDPVILGEWYVLVHVTSESAATSELDDAHDEQDVQNEQAEQAKRGEQAVDDYRDAVWRFERDGDRLRWTLFPEIDFRDESGRYEQVHGARARIHHAWRPTAAQFAEIRAGAPVVLRSARTKTLRDDGAGGWRSVGGARLGSASSVAYGEQWSVEAQPLAFVRAASLRSGRAGSLEGITRYDVEQFDAQGGWIEGRYARDEGERGRFYMWRKGAETERDRAFAANPSDASLLGPGGLAGMSVHALERRIDSGDDARENREAIRAGIQALVEESYARRGLALPPRAAEIEALVQEIERLAVVEGVPLVEIDRRFVAGELLP